jgi:FkbM family methyltransferase
MAANSLPRRVVKRLLAPVLGESSYSVLQAFAMGWDIRSGTWSEPELELLPLGLRAGETAIDIGANYGLYAYHMSRAVGPTGKVYSFEPIPFTARTFRLIQRGLRFGANVELVNKGCGEKSGRVSFTIPVSSTGAIGAGQVHMGRNDERSGKEKHTSFTTKSVEAEVIALDEFLVGAGAGDITMIKCDIEGADLFAMRGARRTLEEYHPSIIIEITPWFLEGFGLKVVDVTTFFTELGYRLYRYEGGLLHPAASEDVVEDNWIFIHPSRNDRFRHLLRTNC